jgi:hypothetical protein
MAKLKSGTRVYGSFSSDALRLTKQLSSTECGTYLGSPPLVEVTNIVSSAANGTSNINVKSGNIWLFTSASTGSWTHNITGDANTTLDSLMLAGESIVVTVISKQSINTRYTAGITIDGTSTTVNWQGGSAPASGLSTAGYDAYTWIITKLSGGSFVVFASQTRFG